MKGVFTEIVSVEVEDDGIVFESKSVKAARIKEDEDGRYEPAIE